MRIEAKGRTTKIKPGESLKTAVRRLICSGVLGRKIFWTLGNEWMLERWSYATVKFKDKSCWFSEWVQVRLIREDT